MKLKDISNMHIATLGIGACVVAANIMMHPEIVQQLMNNMPEFDGVSYSVKGMLENFRENSSFYSQNIFALAPYLISRKVGFMLEPKTEEYIKLKNEYNNVINKFNALCDLLGFDDPISIYIFFIYMYRNGYLSFNHEFKYDTNMKDFIGFNGLDVLRGTGVCRSIASMLNDIYKARNFNSRALIVCVDGSLNVEKFSKAKLQVSKKGTNLAKIVGGFTKPLKISNHLIVEVFDEYDMLLDPTNDVILVREKFKNLSTYDGKKAIMKHKRVIQGTSVFEKLGNLKFDFKVSLFNLFKKKKYSYEEFKNKYASVNEIIENNKELLEEFFKANQTTYESIDDLCADQKSSITRSYL